MGFPHGHHKTTTLVDRLRMTGMVAPIVLDGPIKRRLAQSLCRLGGSALKRGDVVIMDNLFSLKRANVRALFEAAGACLMFLPP